MGAGAYVGRVGGLAVALGIGAAIVAGAGVAAADDGTASGGGTSQSSASTSPTGSRTGSPTTSPAKQDTSSSETTKTTATSGQGTPKTPGGQGASSGVTSGLKDAADEGATPKKRADDTSTHETSTHDTTTHGTTSKPAKKKTRAAESTDQETVTTRPNESAAPATPAADVEPATKSATADEAAPVQHTPEPAAVEVTPAVVIEPATATPRTATAQMSSVTVTKPSETIAKVPTADSHDPAIPAVAALATSLAAAGRETTQEATRGVAAATTTSEVVSTDPRYPIPANVQVTEWVAPLQWLQTIPIAGPLFVVPIVQFIHTIPFIGDVLHPFIGWPLDPYAAAGTPRPRTVQMTSFDGTKIFVNFMPAAGLKAGQTAPTVLDGPGLGLPGATTIDVATDGFLPTDVVGVGTLRNAGYNVVTWDPRGEWLSGGVMYLNSPDYEGRDVSSIISWVASLPEAQLDAANDPRIGMVGASYGGGIQLATAAIDHRVDAIVPTIAWNNLVDVLFPRGAVNSVWGTLLPTVLAVTGQRPFPRIYPVAIQGVLFGIAEQADIDLVNGLGFQDQIKDITAPTLLIQGTVDNLFTLDQADLNARDLIAAGTTTKVIWYCGGHGTCLSDYNDGKVVIDRTMDWLARYLKDEEVDTGPQFEYVDQNGTWFGSDTYPAKYDTTPIVAEFTDPKTLAYVPVLGGSGPNPLILTRGPISALLGLGSAAAAVNAINLHLPAATTLTHVVGAPELTLTYSGSGSAKTVYAQIVDDQSGLVLGNQVTPIPVTLDGATHTVTYSLEQVAQTLQPGQSVTVQILTSATKYVNFYSLGSITVKQATITLPTLGEAVVSREPVVAA